MTYKQAYENATADDTPVLWKDMTPEQKGALLLAHLSGGQGAAKHQVANTRRIARVPDMEDRILADDEVMKAVGEWVAARGFGDTCDKAAWDRLAKAEAALSAAYRAAVEEGRG